MPHAIVPPDLDAAETTRTYVIIEVQISVPSGKTKQMLTHELFSWHFGANAICKVTRCRIDGPQPFMDNVNAVEMVLEFSDEDAAGRYYDETMPKLEASGYILKTVNSCRRDEGEQ